MAVENELKIPEALQRRYELSKTYGGQIFPYEYKQVIERIARLEAENAALTTRHLILRRAYHNVEGHNQFLERCENPYCNPKPTFRAAEAQKGSK